MERINITGTSCSGKTTLSRAVSRRLAITHVELDALFWGPNWTPVSKDTFRARVAAAVAGDRWVVDGGYSPIRDLTWSRADTLVWLDYPMATVLRRWARRTLARVRSREEFWAGTGNRERLSHVAGPNSLLWWILRTHRGRRARIVHALDTYPHLALVHLRSPADARRWLEGL